MNSVSGHHVQEAVDEMLHVLSPLADADWFVPAGSLTWSCWETANHVAHDLGAYAGQIAGQARTAYLPFDVVVALVPARDVLAVIEACGRLLAAAVEYAEPDALGWHWGLADASGFAAMGVAEILVHTYDITLGLGVDWRPPAALSQFVIDRLLPDAPPGPSSDVVLWATGRGDLPGHPRITTWVWQAALD
jgi:hypothetical protein